MVVRFRKLFKELIFQTIYTYLSYICSSFLDDGYCTKSVPFTRDDSNNGQTNAEPRVPARYDLDKM